MSTNEIWTVPPVAFYFSVEFSWGKDYIAASFMEISGLEQEIELDEISQIGKDGNKISLPKSVKHQRLTLKRPLEHLSLDLSVWINDCFSFLEGGWIEPCTLTVRLRDKEHEPVAAWVCTRAFPVNWKLDTLDSQKSALSMETLIFTYSKLIRTM